MDADKIVENAKVVMHEVLRKKPSDAKGDYLKSAALSSTRPWRHGFCERD